MNKTKISNPVRLIAFFLTALVLVCTFGFTVDGWQNIEDKGDLPSGELTQKEDTEDRPTVTLPVPDEPEIYIPEYINRLTGLETTEEISKTTPLAFIMDSVEGCYGISRSDIIVEIPTEDDKTRLISFITDRAELWKIGSLTNGRGYITNLSKYFGAVAVYNGNDDKISYDSCDTSLSSLDLTINSGYHYTEYSSKTYTNCDLISAGLKASGIKDIKSNEVSLPYAFNEFGEENIIFEKTANQIEIIREDGSKLQLKYNVDNSQYTYYKNGTITTDALNGKSLEFSNCFVLFADSVTYDKSDCSQMVMDTIGNGKGYYITQGSYTEIKWNATKMGVMNFYLSTGEKLTVNRGNSYICYVKSSKNDSVIFS